MQSQFPQVNIEHNIGNVISVPNALVIKTQTFVANNVNAGVTNVPSDNASDFSAGTILLLLGSMGGEQTEIVTSPSHSVTSFTTAVTTVPHSRGDSIAELNFDQIVIYKSATLGGVYSLFATQTFQVTQQITVVNDPNGLATDYYKIQWRNSVTGLLSGFSDPISVTAYPENSVMSAIVAPVLSAMGVSPNDPRINADFLVKAVNDARRYTQGKLYGIRQDWQEEFEFPIKLLAGTNYVNLPEDIDFNRTDRSLLSARFLIGNVLTPFNLRYIDKRSWNQISFQMEGGETTQDYSSGATSIQLTSTGDFPDAGVAYVATNAYNEVIIQIAYTGNNKATNTLTGVTGLTRNIVAGTQVWMNPSIVQPIYYTVFEGRLVFERIIPDSMQGNNVYIDYYKKIDDVVSLYQVLPEHYREIYKWYLRYAVKYRKDINTPSDDPDYKKFEELVQALFNNLYTGQDTVIVTG